MLYNIRVDSHSVCAFLFKGLHYRGWLVCSVAYYLRNYSIIFMNFCCSVWSVDIPFHVHLTRHVGHVRLICVTDHAWANWLPWTNFFGPYIWRSPSDQPQYKASISVPDSRGPERYDVISHIFSVTCFYCLKMLRSWLRIVGFIGIFHCQICLLQLIYCAWQLWHFIGVCSIFIKN